MLDVPSMEGLGFTFRNELERLDELIVLLASDVQSVTIAQGECEWIVAYLFDLECRDLP